MAVADGIDGGVRLIGLVALFDTVRVEGSGADVGRCGEVGG